MDSSLPTRSSLLLRLRNHDDSAAWQQFIELYLPVVHNYLRRHGLQDADAADVAQDTMQKVSRAIGKLDYDRGKGRFRGWLLTITRRNLITHAKRAKRAPAGSGDTAVHELLAALPERPDEQDALEWDCDCQQQVLRWAMQQVREHFEEKTWRAFCRTAIENRPAQEVADELRMNVSAVYTAKSRVTARLRRAIQELEDEE
jgi:RNA polymerase sigma-70 factor (ECF subfamily)